MALAFRLPTLQNSSYPCLPRSTHIQAGYGPGLHRPRLHSRHDIRYYCFSTEQDHAVMNPDPSPRRSANYVPSLWTYDFMQSLQRHDEGVMAGRMEELNEAVRSLLHGTFKPLEQLELIDTIERLGLGYLFEGEIEEMLKAHQSYMHKDMATDLHATALRFRLLRQHGHEIPQGVFRSFMDGMGNFKPCLCKDVKGMLSLYEASYLSVPGETILTEARNFTSIYLTRFSNAKVDSHILQRRLVDHALEVPLHWRMPRSDVRWAIDTSAAGDGVNPVLIELAKLDFNRVQAVHQAGVRKMSRWWSDMGLGKKLSFSRDRLMECFYMGVGMVFEPQFGSCREVLTKVAQLITTMDDVYDVYGSLDELELFTKAVDEWDAKAVDQLPYYMKMCFLVLYNTTNEIAYDILKDQGLDVMPYLSKAWADFCKAMLMEAKWYSQGYQPSLEEYLNNGWISSSGGVLLAHGFFMFKPKMTKETLDDCFGSSPGNIIRWPSMMIRLCNDLASSKAESERGDAPTSIQCYMHDADIPESAAREHIRALVEDTWKKINKECCGPQSPHSEPFRRLDLNLARMIYNVYLHGDGHSVPDPDVKDRIASLLVQPIPIPDPTHFS